MKTSKRNYVDVVQDRGEYAVIFVPNGMVLGRFGTSPRASAAKNAELIATIGRLFEAYMRETFGLL